MHAAVVRSFDHPPRYETFEDPRTSNPGQAIVEVLAVGLHPRVRSGASGQHYTSSGTLPMIPGIDGVGTLEDGRRVYFASPDDVWGSMAERAVVDLRRCIPVAEDVDVVRLAAAMNPAMSSWVALRRRVLLEAGQSVLVLGATGNAGQMAVQVAKLLGAGRVVGAGRDPDQLAILPSLGADETVSLSHDPEEFRANLADAAADVDIVIDYVWGEPATSAMMALLTARADRSRPMDWIQIGAMAGPTIELPSVALRSANLRIQGSGQGSVSPEAYLAELPALVDEIAQENIRVNTRAVLLSDVETAWSTPAAPGIRTVIVP
jgi:NADPH:quinone reductase-like Zn-dependent oxidoreductase